MRYFKIFLLLARRFSEVTFIGMGESIHITYRIVKRMVEASGANTFPVDASGIVSAYDVLALICKNYEYLRASFSNSYAK